MNHTNDISQRQRWKWICADFVLFFILCCTLIWIAWKGWGQNSLGFGHLGAEYINIATSLAKNGTYSDPFNGPTGPTAWMPPLLPFLMSFALIVGGKQSLMVAFVVFQVIVVSSVFTWVVYHARRLGIAWAGRLIGISFLVSDTHNLVETTDDCCLLLGLTTLGISGLFAQSKASNQLTRNAVLWGVLGGVTALASPICAYTWGLLTCWSWRSRLRCLFLCMSVAFLCTLPWTIRNFVVFGEFVPIKSNAGFEAWQANILDEDGVIDYLSTRPHPCLQEGEHRIQIRSMGEVAYCRSLGRQFSSWVRENPLSYAKKVLNRVESTTIACEYTYLSRRQPWFWENVPPIILALPWLTIPFALVLRNQIDQRYWILLAWAIIFLFPYWVVSYVDRYGAAIVGIKAMMVLFVTKAFLSRPLKNGTTEPINA